MIRSLWWVMITVNDRILDKSQSPCVVTPLYDDVYSILLLNNERWSFSIFKLHHFHIETDAEVKRSVTRGSAWESWQNLYPMKFSCRLRRFSRPSLLRRYFMVTSSWMLLWSENGIQRIGSGMYLLVALNTQIFDPGISKNFAVLKVSSHATSCFPLYKPADVSLLDTVHAPYRQRTYASNWVWRWCDW